MLIIFNKAGSEFNVDFQYDSFSQGDSNVHIVDVIVDDTAFSTYEYNGYVQFLREGEKEPSPKLIMATKRFERNGNYYSGYTFKMDSDWYTAIAGTLKMTIEIKKFSNGALQSNKAYGVVNIPINASVSAQAEVDTSITDAEYNAFVELINSKFNKDDYDIERNSFDVEEDFADDIITIIETDKTIRKIFFATIGDVNDKYEAIGLGFEYFGNYYCAVLSATGLNKYQRKNDYVEKVNFDFNFEDLSIKKLEVSEKISVPTPTENNDAVNKKYLEDNYDKKEDVVHKSGEKAEVITGQKTFTEAIKVDGGEGYKASYSSSGFSISKDLEGYSNSIDSEVDEDFARLTISENDKVTEHRGYGIYHYNRILGKGYDVYYPTASGTLATEEFVEQKVNELLDNAPEEFNTLKELADYVKSDETATSKLLSDVNNLKENKADKSELENIDYEEIKNKPAEAIFVVRDKVSDDTTQTAKEIEINGTKWAVGGEGGSSGGSEIVELIPYDNYRDNQMDTTQSIWAVEFLNKKIIDVGKNLLFNLHHKTKNYSVDINISNYPSNYNAAFVNGELDEEGVVYGFFLTNNGISTLWLTDNGLQGIVGFNSIGDFEIKMIGYKQDATSISQYQVEI
jgi:hypothetical protein